MIASGNISIIIVDEDQSTAKGIALALQPYCPNITMTHSAVHAKKLLQENTYSMIMSEIKFTTEEGLKVIKSFKNLSPITPIIIISAYLNDKLKADLKKIGIESILEKPIHTECLKNEIYRLIK